jgi:hypothetical protein
MKLGWLMTARSIEHIAAEHNALGARSPNAPCRELRRRVISPMIRHNAGRTGTDGQGKRPCVE